MHRILRPRVPCPAQKAVQPCHRRIHSEPERLLNLIVAHRVRVVRATAHVIGRAHSLLTPGRRLGDQLIGKMPKPKAAVIESNAGKFRRSTVSGEMDAEARRLLTDERHDVAHIIRASFINADPGVIEPPLLLHVGGKINKEVTPVRLERVRTGHGFLGMRRAVLILPCHRIVPRTHRVAANVRSQPAGTAERDILVEDAVVELPRTVLHLDVAHHGTVGIIALVIPGLIEQRHRKPLRASISEHFPKRLHRGVVCRRERLYVEIARHRPRMLPEVKIVLPFLRGRQHAVDDRDLHVAGEIDARLHVRRHRHRQHLDARIGRAPCHTVGKTRVMRPERTRQVADLLGHANLDLESFGRHADLHMVVHDARECFSTPERDILGAGRSCECHQYRQGR